MKRMLFALLFVAMSVPSLSQAAGELFWVTCGNFVFGSGGISVMYTGFSTFNVTEFNSFGFPMVNQQAQVVGVQENGDNDVSFMLKGLVDGEDYKLDLIGGTTQGYVTKRSIYSRASLVCNSVINLYDDGNKPLFGTRD